MTKHCQYSMHIIKNLHHQCSMHFVKHQCTILCSELATNDFSFKIDVNKTLFVQYLAVYPANYRSPRTRANSRELERTRANSARTRQRFANTDSPPNSAGRSPEYAERSPEFGGVRPGSPEFAHTPPRTRERFARKFVRRKKSTHL